ncbi:hypothetical protein QAD02_006799 [Eretmocerus hayati]|uniref:Uncharacterized protein n=1 Tax=Eretmocerus hayati TaxID=131215 RepID=A0ACC2N284_9HYME|nr:hypothetical protein QAD02_006799 [Eretmocerus hayati]
MPISVSSSLGHRLGPVRHRVGPQPNPALERYPFVVKLLLGDRHVCDGSLIFKDIVLSESDCIVERMPFDYNKITPYYVLLNLRAQLGNNKNSTLEVAKIVYRDKFALLKLQSAFPVDASSDKIVEMAGSEEDIEIFGNATAVTQGKFTSFTGNTSTVDLFISPDHYCVDQLPSRGSSEICVRHLGPDYCPTHKGGPIVLKNRQVAIISSINIRGLPNPCFIGKKFGTYPSIIGARGWIDSTVKLLDDGAKNFGYPDFVINVHSVVNR